MTKEKISRRDFLKLAAVNSAAVALAACSMWVQKNQVNPPTETKTLTKEPKPTTRPDTATPTETPTQVPTVTETPAPKYEGPIGMGKGFDNLKSIGLLEDWYKYDAQLLEKEKEYLDAVGWPESQTFEWLEVQRHQKEDAALVGYTITNGGKPLMISSVTKINNEHGSEGYIIGFPVKSARNPQEKMILRFYVDYSFISLGGSPRTIPKFVDFMRNPVNYYRFMGQFYTDPITKMQQDTYANGIKMLIHETEKYGNFYQKITGKEGLSFGELPPGFVIVCISGKGN